jgi:hypothetical protein
MLSKFKQDPNWNSGEKNGFFGRTHTPETKEKIAKRDTAFLKTASFSEAVKKGMNGKSNTKPAYQCWLEKYGEEEANRRQDLLKKKRSVNSTGKNNPMYGRPSPQGSGNGWQGWLDGIYFSSLRELSFRITVLQNCKWRRMERKSDAIQYKDYIGKVRNYFPDFLIESEKVVEIKPKRLWNTPVVTAKKTAATAHCKKHGWIYEMIDPPIVATEILQNLVQEGRLKFMERYHRKFEEWINKSSR